MLQGNHDGPEHQETIDEKIQRSERPTVPVPRAQLSDAYLMAEFEREKRERERADDNESSIGDW